jgi:hypothetical protein
VVLVIEDAVLVRIVQVDILREAGFRVAEAQDADEAFEMLRSRSEIVIVLTDVDTSFAGASGPSDRANGRVPRSPRSKLAGPRSPSDKALKEVLASQRAGNFGAPSPGTPPRYGLCWQRRNRIRPHRLVNVFDLLLAQIGVGQRQGLSDISMGRP